MKKLRVELLRFNPTNSKLSCRTATPQSNKLKLSCRIGTFPINNVN